MVCHEKVPGFSVQPRAKRGFACKFFEGWLYFKRPELTFLKRWYRSSVVTAQFFMADIFCEQDG
jgi:hypothetical protein